MTPSEQHCRALENMYRSAPIIDDMFPSDISISEGEATVELEVSNRMFNAAGTLHGSVTFMMLDNAAFFAAASLEQEAFVVTTSFTTYLTRPVTAGVVTAIGRVVNQSRTQFIAEAVVRDDENREAGRGSGIYVRSRFALAELAGYQP